MEINGEIRVDLDALGEAAVWWLAGADELVAALERLRVESGGEALGPEVAEAFALLVRAWTRAGASLARDLTDHAASLQASASEYAAADSQATRRHDGLAARRHLTALPGLEGPS